MLLRMLFGVLPLLVATGCLAERKGSVFAEYISPEGAYQVRLSGRPQPVPGGMGGWGVHIIRAEVRRGDRVVVPAREIRYADSMDDSFSQDYCDADWVFKNVLRFQSCYPLANARHRTNDTVVLRNAGSQSMKFVQISTNTDMVIFLDLPAQRDIRVPISGRTDQNWFRLRGVWADGQELPTAAPNFYDLPSGGSEFTVTVESQQVEVVRRDSPPNRPLQPTSGAQETAGK